MAGQTRRQSAGLKGATMASLLNKRQVREYALHRARFRVHKFTRVGGGFYVKCEAHLRDFIDKEIHRLPSKGKTIQ